MNSNIEVDIKYWAVHGGSDSYFAAKNLDDAKEYGNPESSRVEVVQSDDLEEYFKELSTRIEVGDADYLNP